MKYVAILILLLSAASCTKKKCWQCQNITWEYTSKTIDTNFLEVCDKTEDDIKAYSDGNTGWTHYPNYDSFYVKMECH